MQVMVERAGAVDVGKRIAVACVRTPDVQGQRRQQTRTFRTFTQDLQRLRDWLMGEQVTLVVMEATGVYWLPIWYALADSGIEVQVVNAAHVKRVPGRKTDVKDAEWLAQLAECGLLRGSFIPPQPIRELRDLTRYRAKLVQEHTREAQRLNKVLEDAQIKLSSVASDPLGVSGRAMLRALVAGERDPAVLTDLARGQLRKKEHDLTAAMTGRFNQHHAFLVRLHLDHLETLEASIAELDQAVDRLIAPFEATRDLLDTIPGVGRRTAEVIIAETGADMTRFPTAACLASWAAVCPGNHESAGKHRSGKTRKGNPWLRTALVESAWAAARTKDTYLGTKFWRLARRRGEKRAAMAIGHDILVIAWYITSRQQPYHDLGTDWAARHTDRATHARRLIHQLEQLGMRVTVEDPAA